MANYKANYKEELSLFTHFYIGQFDIVLLKTDMDISTAFRSMTSALILQRTLARTATFTTFTIQPHVQNCQRRYWLWYLGLAENLEDVHCHYSDDDETTQIITCDSDNELNPPSEKIEEISSKNTKPLQPSSSTTTLPERQPSPKSQDRVSDLMVDIQPTPNSSKKSCTEDNQVK